MQQRNIFKDKVHVTVTRTLSADGNTPKNAGSDRIVPIILKMHNLLSLATHEAKQYYAENEKEFTDASYIFVNEDGLPISYTTLNYYFNKVSDQIDFHIFPHMMRHAFATFASKIADDQKDVANILGHKNVEMTQYYDTGTDTGARKIVVLLDHLNE